MKPLSLLSCVAILIAVAPGVLGQTTQTYTYDDKGRLHTVTYPSGAKTGYVYDGANNRVLSQTALDGVLNSPPSCGNMPYVISGVPPFVPTITVSASFSPLPCHDPDGDPLTVTPTSATTFTLAANQSFVVTFTVSDGKGGTAAGSLTYFRP